MNLNFWAHFVLFIAYGFALYKVGFQNGRYYEKVQSAFGDDVKALPAPKSAKDC